MQNPDVTKLYMITRRDLSPAQQTVQTAHAAFSFMAKYALDP